MKQILKRLELIKTSIAIDEDIKVITDYIESNYPADLKNKLQNS